MFVFRPKAYLILKYDLDTHYQIMQSPGGKYRLDLEEVPREIRRVASSRSMFSVIPGFILGRNGHMPNEENPEKISKGLGEFARGNIGVRAAELGIPEENHEKKMNEEIFGGGKTLSQMLEEFAEEYEAEGGRIETSEAAESGGRECKEEEEFFWEEVKEFVRAEMEGQASKRGLTVEEYKEKTHEEIFGGGKTLSQILEEFAEEYEAEGGRIETAEMAELGDRECKGEEEFDWEEVKEFVRAEIEGQARKYGLTVKEFEEKTHEEIFGGGKTLSQILEEFAEEYEAEGGRIETSEVAELGGRERYVGENGNIGEPPDSESDAFKSIFGESGEELSARIEKASQIEEEAIFTDPIAEETAASPPEVTDERAKVCPGLRGQPCVFSTETPGGPTEFKKSRTKCIYCDPLLVQNLMSGKYRGDNLRKSTRCLQAEFQDKFQRRLPADLKVGKPNERKKPCAGRPGEPCRFNTSKRGKAALSPYGKNQCVFCEDDLQTLSNSEVDALWAAIAYDALGSGERELVDKRLPLEIRRRIEGVRDVKCRPEGDAMRMPAPKRRRISLKKCPGAVELGECVFSIEKPGTPANVSPGSDYCCFCAPEFPQKMAMRKSRERLTDLFRKLDRERRNLVNAKLPEARKIGDARARKVPEKWEDVLTHRSRAYGFDNEETEKAAYRKQVLDDRRRAAVKMKFNKPKHPAKAKVENDSGLPGASISERAKDFERWCVEGSWVMCQQCHSMQPRDLTEGNLIKKQHDATVLPKKNCNYCRKFKDNPPPRPQDVPIPLRGLPPKVIKALSPVEIDTGKEVRAHYSKHMRTGTATGYRQHTGMIRFYWGKKPVKQKIGKLDRRNRRIAKEAYKYLKHSKDCAYYGFIKEHRDFLQETGKPSKLDRKRRLDFIESVGLECALWPHLFWRTDMCFTHVRKTDARRLKKKRKRENRKPTNPNFDISSSESEGAVEGEECHSVKRSYRAMIMSPLLGYGSYDILHFAYDLAMWSALGSAKNVAGDRVPIRVMLKSFPFTSMYWRSVHDSLIDLVRQIGPPQIFFTMAPYEWTFPYHKWILDDMAKLLRSRIYLPHGESLHQAHVMLQTVRGLICGRQGGQWEKHSLCANKEDGDPLWIHYFTRLEYQDGTRKKPTQGYHGSGRPHIHVLIWTDSLEEIPLGSIASATTRGLSAEMKGYVRGSQDDNNYDSKWKVSREPNHWDRRKGTWALEHHHSDKKKGRRAFFKDIMDATKCHQDIQYSDGYAALQQYVVGYVNKANDAATDDMQDDSLEANALALNILTRYKPMEPEMVLQMCQQRFRIWDVGTVTRGRRDAWIPLPDTPTEKLPNFISQYQRSSFAGKISKGNRIRLIDFLRKTNKDGQISQWLQRKHQKDGSGESLQSFARNYWMRGEQIVSASMYSRNNDKFFGQWMVLNVPFEKIQDLMVENSIYQVPPDMKYFAIALNYEDDGGHFWRTETRVKKEMAQEGRANKDVDSFWNMVKAQTSLVDDYEKGILRRDPDSDVGEGVNLADGEGRRDLPDVESVELDRHQRRFEAHVLEACKRSAEIRKNDGSKQKRKDLDTLMTEARKSQAAICTGPPGTGKTTAIFSCIDEVLKNDGKVLFALPTAQLASRMRQKYSNQRRTVVIDTCAAAFELMGNGVTELPTLSDFDLIVVDEVSLIEKQSFERILKLWNHVDRTPALVFLGDDYQMGGYGERPWLSKRWKTECFEYKLKNAYRCKDPKFWSMLKKIRRDVPSKELLGQFLAGRKAWMGSPTIHEVRKVLEKHPDTTIMTCTRKAASRVNFQATRAYFADKKPLAYVEADYESYHVNYDGPDLKPIDKLTANNIPIYKDMKLYITQNVKKEADFVNGMRCKVEKFCSKSQAIRVRTDTKKRLMIYRWTDPARKFPAHYPVRQGYCSTIMKFQGATLKHATIYLDCPKIKGAAYTALSRVARRKDYLLGGYLKPHHFTPADGRRK